MHNRYCPDCGAELTPHQGKYCTICAAKRKKTARRVAVGVGLALVACGVAVCVVAYRDEKFRGNLKKLAERIPVEQGAEALMQTAAAAQEKAKALWAQTEGLREQAKEVIAEAQQKFGQ
ncbi:MAG: hypothetical protein IJT18_04290 [Oscillospiraceae bacterium]|nr:hypothetical protein [Oscillospiraceae bacterium]